MNRRRFLGSSLGLVVAAAAGAATVAGPLSARVEDPADEPTRSASAATALVGRGDLQTTREFRATVSFGELWMVPTAATGTVTSGHPAGTVVAPGTELVRIDDQPVFLAAGTMPMFRELHRVDTRGRDELGNRRRLQEGDDVSQLQAFLLDAGYDAEGTLAADGTFGKATEDAVKAWQREVGIPPSGRVDASQIVFGPDPLRIATTLRVGDPFESLEVTTSRAIVLVDTSARDRTALEPGGEVTVTVPDQWSGTGVVRSQEQVIGDDGAPVWRTTIDVDGELSGRASAATVEVVEEVADDVLYVPVSALLALAEGGFAVEIVDEPGTRLVRVELGEVLDGRAEVRGELTEGTEVVVPT